MPTRRPRTRGPPANRRTYAHRRANVVAAYNDGYKMYKTIQPYLPLNVEIKQGYDYPNFTNLTTTHQELILNAMVKGDNSYNRQGDAVRMTSLEYHLTFQMNSASTVPHQIRWAIVVDRFASGVSSLATTKVWGAGFSINSLRSNSDQERFKVIKEGVINISPGVSGEIQHRKGYMKIPKFLGKVKYNSGNAGTAADISVNAFYFAAVSSVTTNAPSVTGSIKINYIDN